VSLHPFTEGLVAVHAHGNQAFGRKGAQTWRRVFIGDFPHFAQTGYHSTFRSLSQRDRGNAFKFGISLSRDSAMRNPKLNGSGH